MSLFKPLADYFIQFATKQDALFHYLRDRILYGDMTSHHKLPPTRELAAQLQLSRGTVSNVYDMLTAQGYLYSIAGSGTFVSPYIGSTALKTDTPSKPLKLSDWGNRVLLSSGLSAYKQKQDTAILDHSYEPISFRVNQVNVVDFPLSSWNKAIFEHTRKQVDLHDMSSVPAAGDTELRQAIAQHLHTNRGFHCKKEHIVIVNGSLQALTLLAQLFINQNDYVALENPHYSGMRAAIEALGGQIDTYPIDEEGINFDPKRNDYRLIYLTPNRQFPTGAVLSLSRRQKLLEWAKTRDCFIIEDDYDSEFSFQSRALEPLKALDSNDQVIYIGTFSRTMMQHIRIGYVVLPEILIEPFVAAKMMYERVSTAVVQQRALATFMLNGQYDRHLRRLKRIYRERATVFYEMLSQRLSDFLLPYPLHAGLHLYVEWIAHEEHFEPFLIACHQLNIQISSASGMYLVDEKKAICLGFAHLSILQIEEGIERLRLAYDTIISSSSQ